MNKKMFTQEIGIIMGGIIIIILTEAIGPSILGFSKLGKIIGDFILKTTGSSFLAGMLRTLIFSSLSFLGYFFAGVFVGYLSELKIIVSTICVSIFPLIYTMVHTLFSKYAINTSLTYYVANILLIIIFFFICLSGVIIGQKFKQRKIIQNTSTM